MGSYLPNKTPLTVTPVARASVTSDRTIVGTSDVLKYVMYRVEQVAATSATVLLLGETGTGKELIARAIHNESPRRHKKFVVVNCGALPPPLGEAGSFVQATAESATMAAHANRTDEQFLTVITPSAAISV